MKAIVNTISISKKADTALKQSRYVGLARNAANTRFVIAHQILLEKFDSHKVTQEIAAGPDAEGDILPDGNLFSFLGFYEGAEPQVELREYLDKKIEMDDIPTFDISPRRFIYNFNVDVPEIQDVYDATPVTEKTPSDSWVKAIEKGIGSFAEYVYSAVVFKDIDKSKSKSALQNRTKNNEGRPDRVLGIPYINELLKEFINKFK